MDITVTHDDLVKLPEHDAKFDKVTGVEKRDCVVHLRLTDAEYKRLDRLAYTCGGSRQLALRNMLNATYVEHMHIKAEARKPVEWSTMHLQLRASPLIARYMSQYRGNMRTDVAKKLIKLGMAYLKTGNYHVAMFRNSPKRDSLTSFRLDGELLTALDKAAHNNGMPIRTFIGILMHVGLDKGSK